MKIKPLQIAGLTIENPFILAPLAGYTDLPFRLLCREYGAGLVFSEMISCHGLHFRLALATERQNKLNQVFCPHTGVLDLGDVIRDFAYIVGQIDLGKLGKPEDGR